MKHRIFFLILTISLLACDTNSKKTEVSSEQEKTSSNDGQTINACGLFSKSDAESALKFSVKEPESKPYNPVTKAPECFFESVDVKGGFETSGSLLIRVERLANPAVQFTELRKLMGDVENIAGLGNNAFYGASQLFVLHGARIR